MVLDQRLVGTNTPEPHLGRLASGAEHVADLSPGDAGIASSPHGRVEIILGTTESHVCTFDRTKPPHGRRVILAEGIGSHTSRIA